MADRVTITVTIEQDGTTNGQVHTVGMFKMAPLMLGLGRARKFVELSRDRIIESIPAPASREAAMEVFDIGAADLQNTGEEFSCDLRDS